jgi:hypothetical protein
VFMALVIILVIAFQIGLVSAANAEEFVVGYNADSSSVELSWNEIGGAASYNVYRQEKPPKDCFIATAAYGSSLDPSVSVLRQFRDTFMLGNKAGSYLAAVYYHHSPAIAEQIAGSEILKGITRVVLIPFIVLAFISINYAVLLPAFMLAGLLVYTIRKRKLVKAFAMWALIFVFVGGMLVPSKAAAQDNPVAAYELLANVTDRSYIDTDVQAGKTYHYIVAALDSAQEVILYSDAVEVAVPERMPYFNVDPTNNDVWGHDWLPDTGITVTVRDGSNTLFTGTVQSDEHGNFGLQANVDIVAGYLVTVTDGELERTHEVTLLQITTIDTGANIIYGTAEPGTYVSVDVEADGNPRRNVLADGTGNWEANFNDPGVGGGENLTHNIGPGSWGAAQQSDGFGNATRVHWYAPDSLSVHPDTAYVDVYDGANDVTFTQEFVLSLGYAQFNENLLATDFALGGVFTAFNATVEVTDASRNGDNHSEAFITVSGILNISEADWQALYDQQIGHMEGNIIVGGSAHSGNEQLTANVWLIEPPRPWADFAEGDYDFTEQSVDGADFTLVLNTEHMTETGQINASVWLEGRDGTHRNYQADLSFEVDKIIADFTGVQPGTYEARASIKYQRHEWGQTVALSQ